MAVASKKKKTIKPIAKPYLRGTLMGRTVLLRAVKLPLYALIFIAINLFLGAAFSFEGSVFLRVVMNCALIAGCVLLLYSAGQNVGYNDITFAEIMYNHQQEGKPVSPEERDRCYHPLKGAVTAALGYLPLLILALIYALTAQKQVFSLPPLPGWVSGYSDQGDLGTALQYYQSTAPMTAAGLLRIVMRMMIYPYINLVGARSADMTLLMDRLSPLTLSLPYLGYAIGYLRGRHSRAMLHGSMAAADRKKRRRANRKPARKTENHELV